MALIAQGLFSLFGPRPKHDLIDTGPFGLVRHPIVSLSHPSARLSMQYASSIITQLANALMCRRSPLRAR